MREIKFRAWDGEKMLDDVPPSLVPLGANAVIRGTTCEVMQFTGLKDKNGKEIYEGDIVDGRFYNERKLFEVKYDAENAEYYQFSSYAKSEDGWVGDFEVIGNIYENPDLLK